MTPWSCFFHLVQLRNGFPAVTVGPLGVSLLLLGVDCTKISSCQTPDFLWFTFSRFRTPGREFDDVLRAYTLTPMMPIFVKHMALQRKPLFLQSPSLTLTLQPFIPTLWSSCHLSAPVFHLENIQPIVYYFSPLARVICPFGEYRGF